MINFMFASIIAELNVQYNIQIYCNKNSKQYNSIKNLVG
jgi:hypothetical protein